MLLLNFIITVTKYSLKNWSRGTIISFCTRLTSITTPTPYFPYNSLRYVLLKPKRVTLNSSAFLVGWVRVSFGGLKQSLQFRGASFKTLRGNKAYGLAKSASSHILTYFAPFNFHLATRVKQRNRNEKETDIVRFVLSCNTSLASLVPRFPKRSLLARCPREVWETAGERTPWSHFKSFAKVALRWHARVTKRR